MRQTINSLWDWYFDSICEPLHHKKLKALALQVIFGYGKINTLQTVPKQQALINVHCQLWLSGLEYNRGSVHSRTLFSLCFNDLPDITARGG